MPTKELSVTGEQPHFEEQVLDLNVLSRVALYHSIERKGLFSVKQWMYGESPARVELGARALLETSFLQYAQVRAEAPVPAATEHALLDAIRSYLAVPVRRTWSQRLRECLKREKTYVIPAEVICQLLCCAQMVERTTIREFKRSGYLALLNACNATTERLSVLVGRAFEPLTREDMAVLSGIDDPAAASQRDVIEDLLRDTRWP